MKKSLALGLACAMVLSMGAAVSAKTDDSLYPVGAISETAYLYDSDLSAVDLANPVERVAYGETMYFPLLNVTATDAGAAIAAAEAVLAEKQAELAAATEAYDNAMLDSGNTEVIAAAEAAVNAANAAVAEAQAALDAVKSSTLRYVYESDAVSGIKVKQKWDMNSKLVKGVEIAKKKVAGETLSQKYIYFVAVSLADSTSTSSADVVGDVQLRKSGSFDYEDMQLDVNIEVAFPVAENTEITEDLQIFKEGNGFIGDTEEEFTFECDEDSYFAVNTIGQGKLLLSATNKFDSKIADLYPNANLNFFYGNGASFNKTGTLYLSADEGSFLYQVNSDGTMVKVNAEYDEYDEAFVIKTRALGKYIISDTELKIVNIPSDGGNNGSTGGTVTPSNPSTGAAL